MTTQETEITAEAFAEWEQHRLNEFGSALESLLRKYNLTIQAVPILTQDGRLTAQARFVKADRY